MPTPNCKYRLQCTVRTAGLRPKKHQSVVLEIGESSQTQHGERRKYMSPRLHVNVDMLRHVIDSSLDRPITVMIEQTKLSALLDLGGCVGNHLEPPIPVWHQMFGFAG